MVSKHWSAPEFHTWISSVYIPWWSHQISGLKCHPPVCWTHLHFDHRPERSARLSGHINNFTLTFALGWQFGISKHSTCKLPPPVPLRKQLFPHPSHPTGSLVYLGTQARTRVSSPDCELTDSLNGEHTGLWCFTTLLVSSSSSESASCQYLRKQA